MHKLAALLLITFACIACRRPCGFYDEVEQVPVAPSAEELAGVYKPDKRSIQLLKTYGQALEDNGHIVITQDQKFILVNTPGLFVMEGKKKIISGTGRFSLALDSISQTQGISVRYQDSRPLKGMVDGQIRLYKKDGKLILFKYINDPDHCEFMLYEKQ